jgi:hypothetical protein
MLGLLQHQMVEIYSFGTLLPEHGITLARLLARKVTLDRKDQQVLKAHKAVKVHKGYQAPKAVKGHRVIQVHKAIQVQMHYGTLLEYMVVVLVTL